MNDDSNIGGWKKFSNIIIVILVLASLWGLSEVALSGLLRMIGFPYRSALLMGVGVGLMAIALAMFKNPLILFGIGIITCMVPLMAVPLLGISITCKANSLIALPIEAGSLSLMVLIMIRKSGKNVYAQIATGGCAGILASAIFYPVGMSLVPCQYLSSFANTGSFIIKEGLTWGAFSAIMLPIGYLAGEKLLGQQSMWLNTRNFYYYAASIAIIFVSLSASGVAIAYGL